MNSENSNSAAKCDSGRGSPPGRSVVITGGGTGIGAAVTEVFLRAGAHVAIIQRTTQDADTARGAFAQYERVRVIAADLATSTGCREAMEQAALALGQIDILINNAAVTGPAAVGAFLEFSEELLDRILAVNLRAPFLCSMHAARLMARKNAGLIVNVGSTASFLAQPQAAAYVATKTGLLGLTRALAVELAKYNIRAVMVAPGAVATQQSSDPAYRAARQSNEVRHPPLLADRATPEQIAQTIAFVCSESAAFMTGSCITVDGGVCAY